MPCPVSELCIFVAGARDLALLEGQNLGLHSRHRVPETSSSAWQAQYFVHEAETLVSAG